MSRFMLGVIVGAYLMAWLIAWAETGEWTCIGSRAGGV